MSLAAILRPSFVLGGLLLMLLCTRPLPAPAQTPPDPDGITLRGQVLADDTGEALLVATVALRRAADSTLVTGTITNAEGRFLVDRVPSGRYALRISYVGFEAVERPDVKWSGGLTAGVGTNATYNGSVNLGYRQNDWTLFSTYGYRTDRRDGSGTRLRENLLQSPSVFLNQRSLDERNRASHAWTTQAEYQLGSETTLGLQTVLSRRGGTEEGQTTNFEEMGGTLTDEFPRLEDGTREDLGLDARLSLDHTFGNEDHVLRGEVRYERAWEDEAGRYLRRTVNEVR